MEEKRKDIEGLTIFFFTTWHYNSGKKKKKESFFRLTRDPNKSQGKKRSQFLRSPCLERNPIKL